MAKRAVCNGKIIMAGAQVKCEDGTWGTVKKIVSHDTLLVRVSGLDEEWAMEVVAKSV